MKTTLTITGLALGLAAGTASAQESYTTAVDGTFAPHAMPTMDGGVEGFNIDLVNALAERLDAEIEIVATQFSSILPGLQAGTYDFVGAPTTITEERAEKYLFSEGYLNTDFQFLVKPGTPEIAELGEFEGKTIAVNQGSVYESWARDLTDEIGWTIDAYGTNTDAVQAVVSGRAFANVAGNTVSAWAAKQNPNVELSYLYSTGLVWGMPFRRGDDALREKFERAIECMKVDGTMADLHMTWFGIPPAEDAAAVTPRPGYGEPGMPGYQDDDHELGCE